jgi:uncharacterized small protein (DUF1192 family)
MYGNEIAEKQTAYAVVAQREDRTVGENLDAKIASLKAELKRLEDSRASLTPLLGMKIRDIRGAMDY